MLGVFGVLALMVWRAYRMREKLELDELECHLTRVSLTHHLITVAISALSLAIILFDGPPGMAGLIYFLMGPVHGVAGFLGGRRSQRIHERLASEA